MIYKSNVVVKKLKNIDQYLLHSLIYFIFLIVNTIYYYKFTVSYFHGPWKEIFGYALSTMDHNVYYDSVKVFNSGGSPFWVVQNNNAIAMGYIYYLLLKIGRNYTIIQVAFFVNNLIILISYLVFSKILNKLAINPKFRFVFFLNPLLIYYSQLINKESFSLLIVLLLLLLLLDNKMFWVYALIPFSMLVRIQYGVFIIFTIYMVRANNFKLSIMGVYIITSFLAIVSFYSAFPESIETGIFGISNIIYQLNMKYYIGSLIFNPLRILLYLYDLLRTFIFITDGYFNPHSFAYIPTCLIIMYYFRPITHKFINISLYSKTQIRYILAIIISFVFVLLMNPITHARYLFPITIPLVILGISTKNGSTRLIVNAR